ncbi:MAG: matrixin family metalloprotease, partial [Candidatus Gastranaerophilales bacterium]|nr:matrixin family metalloprotease [Candidatus Gastranaerophilales bacterium]
KSKIIAVFISLSFLFNICSVPALSQPRSQTNIKQSNNYAKAAHDAYEQRNFLKAAENYEKAYAISKTKVYLDNSLVAYLSLASDYANDKDFNNALKYCNKTLSLSPNDKNAKELMSDIYFVRGTDYFYTGEVDKAKSDVESSLKYSTSKEQTERAKDGLNKIASAKTNGTIPIPKYEGTTDDSMPVTLDKIEKKLYGSSNSSIPLLSRVSKLEKESLGKNYDSDGLIVRVDRLKRAVLPELVTQQSPKKIYEDTYVPDIIEQSMGRVTIFGKMPITVFIDDANVKPYKKFYKDAIIEGFKEWEKASNNVIKFEYIYDPAKADISVSWNEQFEDFPWQPKLQKTDISAEKEKMKYRKANVAVQAGSMLAMVAGSLVGLPFLGTAGYLGGSVASPYLGYKGANKEKLSPDVKINTKITEDMTDDQAKTKLKQTAIHQMGHAIGIYGHSSDPSDIMYSDFKVTQLSERDIKTIQEIYKPKEPEKNTKK